MTYLKQNTQKTTSRGHETFFAHLIKKDVKKILIDPIGNSCHICTEMVTSLFLLFLPFLHECNAYSIKALKVRPPLNVGSRMILSYTLPYLHL